MPDIVVPNYQGASVAIFGPRGYVGSVIRETDPDGPGWRFTAVEIHGRGTYPGYRNPSIAADTLRALDRLRNSNH